MLATLLLTGTIGGDLNVQISQAAFQMAYPVIVLLVGGVVPIAMTITLVVTIARGYLNSASLQIDLGPIFRLIFVLIALLSYRTLVPMVGDSVYWINREITGSASNAQAYATLQQLKPPAATAPPTPQQVAQGQVDQPTAIASLASSIGDKLSAIANFSLSNFIMELATGLVAQLIQVVMLFIQAFLAGFLFVVGPIAFALSMLPGWGGLIKSWFQSFLSVQMWSVAFAIINSLFANYSQAQATLMAHQYSSVNDYLAAHAGQAQYQVGCIVFIIMYLLVPYMTSLIVGHAASDAFMGSAARLATAAAGPAGKGAAALASGVGSMAAAGQAAFGGLGAMFGGNGGGGGGGSSSSLGGMAALGGGPAAVPLMLEASGGGPLIPPSRQLGGSSAPLPSLASVLSPSGGGSSGGAAFIAPAYGGTGTGDFAGSNAGPGGSGSGAQTTAPNGRLLGGGSVGRPQPGATDAGSASAASPPPMGFATGSWGAPLPDNPGAPNSMVSFSSAGIMRGVAAGTGELPPGPAAPASVSPVLPPAPPAMAALGALGARPGGDSAAGAVALPSSPAPESGPAAGAEIPFLPGPPPQLRGGGGSW